LTFKEENVILKKQKLAVQEAKGGEKMNTLLETVALFIVVMFSTLVVFAVIAITIYSLKTKNYIEKSIRGGKLFSIDEKNWYKMDYRWPVLHARVDEEAGFLRVLFVDLRWGRLEFHHQEQL